ncbi:hypothetical protein L596_015432 [Steinernema carpocapsae]|uniref:Uncharacterized protein n=1 Tax=Steinernema carpocapsae TaxID=34508 RepID=A0A4U5NFZ0_STECR|nr:hypothetical protein L596_015432 [Steinernema carpocapsae]
MRKVSLLTTADHRKSLAKNIKFPVQSTSVGHAPSYLAKPPFPVLFIGVKKPLVYAPRGHFVIGRSSSFTIFTLITLISHVVLGHLLGKGIPRLELTC